MVILLFAFGFSSLSVVSQNPETINLKEIPQRKVRKYIASRSIDQMNDFSSIHASWGKGIDESIFKVIEKTFYLKYKLPNVWQSYLHINPFKTWDRHSIRLGLLITKCSNSVIYTHSPSPPDIDTGQVYFLDLKLLKGVFNIPVAFEITNIDYNQQIMEFSYIEKNKSLGKQTIQFFDNGDGRTRIVHRSYFKSDSPLRDDIFYPFFHKIFINEFHRSIRRLSRTPKLACLNGEIKDPPSNSL
ncbi:MAG: hypothetical protein NT092_13550 [Bacteroidia bacterium]|nr:hypothetical protein [Bacteroidia bacterium]